MRDRRFPEPRLREEFRRELRARLMAEAHRTLPRRPGRETAWTSLRRRLETAWTVLGLGRDTAWTARGARRETAWTFLRPAFAVGVAALLLMAGAGTAAAVSVAGDPGFGLKRAVEELQLTLTLDDVGRVDLLAQIADRRLHELEQVAGRPDKAPTASEEYAAAVARFRAAVDALQQAAPQEKVDRAQDVADTARDKHAAILEWLRGLVPDEARLDLDRAQEEEQRETPEEKRQKEREDRRPDRTGSPRQDDEHRDGSPGRAAP